MPTYELSLILRNMPKLELMSVLKRTSASIFQTGGFIRKLESLGSRSLPFKIKAQRTGAYFLIEFDVSPTKIDEIHEEWGRDVDIVRRNIYKKEEKEKLACTLGEELLPPAYNKDVIKMIEKARNSKRSRREQKRTGWNANTGFNYYPFQR